MTFQLGTLNIPPAAEGERRKTLLRRELLQLQSPALPDSIGQHLWYRCVIGTSSQYLPADDNQTWLDILATGNLWYLRSQEGELLILSPASNTENLNVSAYMEAFWS